MSFLRDYLRGAGSLLDLFPTSRERVRPMAPKEAARTDREALASDWEAVCGDLRKVIDEELGKAR